MSEQPPGPQVELVDLSVISRYSLALRCATADAEELADALRADLSYVEGRFRRQPEPRTTRARPSTGAGGAGPRGTGTGGPGPRGTGTGGPGPRKAGPRPSAARASGPSTDPAPVHRPPSRRGTSGG